MADLVPINFTAQNLTKFLESAPPKVIDVIEKDVREKNPWLLGDVTWRTSAKQND